MDGILQQIGFHVIQIPGNSTLAVFGNHRIRIWDCGGRSGELQFRERGKTAAGREWISSSIPVGGIVSSAAACSCNRLPTD
jgi:hypothetical protein